MPQKFLELVVAILFFEKLDKGAHESLDVPCKLTAWFAQIIVSRVEKVRGHKRAQVDDDLLGRRHVALGQGLEHLVGMQLLVQLALSRGVVFIARQEGFGVVMPGAASFPSTTARRHCAIIMELLLV